MVLFFVFVFIILLLVCEVVDCLLRFFACLFSRFLFHAVTPPSSTTYHVCNACMSFSRFICLVCVTRQQVGSNNLDDHPVPGSAVSSSNLLGACPVSKKVSNSFSMQNPDKRTSIRWFLPFY